MNRLQIFGVLVKALWEFVGWLSRLKRKDQPEPIETDLPPADRAGTFTKDIPAKPKVRRTAKRAPPSGFDGKGGSGAL